MPPARKNCNSEMKKQKQIIDNRLLEISILVEDYIYEDKPISRHAAETYAKEVASYADKCLGDIRSLQVIEKLMRHMRGIIAEQGETVDESIFAQPLPGTNSVYSGIDGFKQYKQVNQVEKLTQEFSSIEEPVKNSRNKRKTDPKRYKTVNSGLGDDFTHCAQNIEFEDLNQEFNSSNGVKENVINGRKQRKAIVRNVRHNSGWDDDLTQCTQFIEFEDLTQESSSLNYILTPIKKAKAVERNMRPIYALDDDMTQCTQNIKIQEINKVDSVAKPNTRSRNKINTVVKHNITKTTAKRNISDRHKSKVSDVIDFCDNNDDDNIKEYNNSPNIYKSPQDIISSPNIPNTPAYFSVCSPSILTSFDAVPGIPESKKQEYTEKPNQGKNVIDTEDIFTNIDKSVENIELIKKFNDGKTPEEHNIISTKYIEKINNMKRLQINKRIYTQINDIKNLKNTSNILNVKKTSVNTVEITKNNVHKAYSKINTKSCIYNDKVANDLSWIENIRFIREIAKEEYENVLSPENLWDNYTLPDKWNDDDFLYT